MVLLGSILEFFKNKDNIWAIVGIGLLVLLVLVCLIRLIVKRRKIKKTGINEVGGIRYSAESDVQGADGGANMTYQKGDIVIAQNATEVAGIKNKVKPGKYTVLSTNESMDKINVRIGTYVREIEHGGQIVLAEGESITPVSNSIILR